MSETVKAAKCRGFPEGKDCPEPMHYPILGLCVKCYRIRQNARVHADRERKKAEKEAAGPPGVLVTPESGHAHNCPLCGQGITAQHYRRTPEVQYDESPHPFRLKRALAVNKSRASIAKRFGITESMLDTWIAQFPAMTAAAHAVDEEDEIIYEAAVVKARGTLNPKTGEFQGGDSGLLKMLLLVRHGIADRKPPITEDPHEKLEKAVPIVRDLLKKLRNATPDSENRPDEGDATDAKR